MPDNRDPPPEGVTLEYVVDLPRIALALQSPNHRPVHGWRVAAHWAVYIASLAVLLIVVLRALLGAASGLEAFGAGLVMHVGAIAFLNVRSRISPDLVAQTLGIGNGTRISLLLERDHIELCGVPSIQRFPRSALRKHTEGEGWLCIYVMNGVLPVDLEQIPTEKVQALRRWLDGPDRGVLLDSPPPGPADIEMRNSLWMLTAYSFFATMLHRPNLKMFFMGLFGSMYVGIVPTVLEITAGWNVAVAILSALMLRGVTARPFVLSIEPEGLTSRGPHGWSRTEWHAVNHVRRLPLRLGWVVWVHGRMAYMRSGRGDHRVVAFMERIRDRVSTHPE